MSTQAADTANLGKRRSDAVLAAGVICVLGVMVVPLPTFLMDILLTFNVSFSLIVLVNALYSQGPLQMTVFPSLMLVVTLFRLALNVASTRLILGQAYAGEMISAFGTFVVKDNYVVGSVIFIILVAIQYIVIVKGTERNAEVGARFALDAMPGKQMSIDADLNAGLINEEEALRRREDLSREANFYGAMDGASKFVRGDAIAGIVITLVNIIAGFVVGVLQLKMSASESLATYARLTIGDGLVSQIPALVISTSAGMIVSRSAAGASLGTEMGKQLLRQSKPLVVVSAALGALALVPGIPTLPVMLLALGLLSLARVQRGRVQREQAAAAAQAAPAAKSTEATPEEYLKLDRLEVAVGLGLIPLMDKEKGSDFLDRVVAMRRQLAEELGIIVPPIRIRDDIRVKPDEYEIRMKGHRVASGQIQVGYDLAMGEPAALAKVDGIATKEPAFGLDAKWVGGAAKTRAEDEGLTVVSSSVVLSTHLTEVIKNHAWELLSRQDVQVLLDRLAKDSPAVVKDVVPEAVTLGTVHRVLQNLLKERVPVRDLGTVLEVLADFAPQVPEVDRLSELARAGLSRAISDSCAGPERNLQVIAVHPALEQTLTKAVQEGGTAALAALQPAQTQHVFKQLRAMVKSILDRQQRPALICSPNVRVALRRWIESTFPTIPVLSYHEITSDIDVFSVGTLQLPMTDASPHATDNPIPAAT